MSPAERIEEAAADWLVRREGSDWSEADAAALDAWLEAAPEHLLAFWRLEHGWEKVGRLAALKPTAPAAASPARPFRRRTSWWPAAAAASVALVAAIALFGSRGPAPAESFQTVVGGQETVPLPDDSRVELGTDTRLRTAISRDRREVWLERGEAYFEVAHDPRRPFSVYAGDRKITVLGTKFSVRRDGDRVRVAVLEGRVRVEPLGAAIRAEPVVVDRGDLVVARGASTLVSDAAMKKVAGELSWRRGMLTFDRATLEEAAAEFNRYNRTRLVIGDDAAGRMRIGGAFEARNVQEFAELLRSAYGLTVTRTSDRIEITS
jgi:transmembrane sensor